jgi:molybdate transport system permease protein
MDIMGELSTSLLLSLRIALAATALASLAAIPLAYLLARRTFRGKSIIETLLTLPLVLPPTVVGYLIIDAFGMQSPIGQWMYDTFGMRLLFTEAGAVVASAVVAFPLLLLPARAAFAGVERELEEIARLMGAGPVSVFWHVSLPLARRGIAGGLLLAFARSLGEFGATVMVFGTARKTLPVLVWYSNESGGMKDALPAVCVLLAVSLMVMGIYNRSGLARQE